MSFIYHKMPLGSTGDFFGHRQKEGMGKAAMGELSKARGTSKAVIGGSFSRQGRIVDQFLAFRRSVDLLKPFGSDEPRRKITGA